MAHKVSLAIFISALISKLLHKMYVCKIKVICELPSIEETSEAITKERQVMDHGAGNMQGVIEKRQELTVRKVRVFKWYIFA